MIDDRNCLVYDANGNITQIQELAPNNAVIDTTVYTYDNQGQLTNAASTVNGNWAYQYDTYGNIRGWSYGTDSGAAYTYGDAVWKDLLTGLSVTRNGVTTTGSYVYDGSGNPTTYFSPGDLSTWTMTWKNGRELATATDGTHSLSCDYDVDGLRTYKVVDGVRHDYVYASGQLLRETWTQSGTTYILDFVYDQAGRPYILNVTTTGSNAGGPTPYYYLLNLQGDVVGLVDANGNTAATYTYDAWGNILTSSGSLASLNPLRYRGYYYDAETGFYYLQSRYYDPALGRFINADGYASTGTGFLGYNMFAYCENGAVNGCDPTGSFMQGNLLLCNDGNNNPHGERQPKAPEQYSNNWFYPTERALQKTFKAIDSTEDYLQNNWKNGVEDAAIAWEVYSTARDLSNAIIEPKTKIIIIVVIDVAFLGWTVGRRLEWW